MIPEASMRFSRWMDTLLLIRDGQTISDLGRDKRWGITYAYLCKVIDALKKRGLVRAEKEGRVVRVYLTASGKEARTNLQRFQEDIRKSI